MPRNASRPQKQVLRLVVFETSRSVYFLLLGSCHGTMGRLNCSTAKQYLRAMFYSHCPNHRTCPPWYALRTSFQSGIYSRTHASPSLNCHQKFLNAAEVTLMPSNAKRRPEPPKPKKQSPSFCQFGRKARNDFTKEGQRGRRHQTSQRRMQP